MKFYCIFVKKNVESDFIEVPSQLFKKYNNVRRGERWDEAHVV